MAINPNASYDTASTFWFTGLSGAGKSTIAYAFAEQLRIADFSVCVLDGDELRKGLSSDLGFSIADREEQCRRAAELAKVLNQNHIIALVALISPTLTGRECARNIIGHNKMHEIYIATPLHICQQRDPKGLYAKAKLDPSLQMTGVSAPYEAPQAADCVIDTSQIELHSAVQQLTKFLKV